MKNIFWTCVTLLIVILSVPSVSAQENGQEALFSDDFDDNIFDDEKWSRSGSRVVEEDGVMKVEVTETDNEGRLKSRWIDVNTKDSIVVTRSTKSHYANEYYNTWIELAVKDHPNRNFGVAYANYSYDGNNGTELYGIHITRNNARPHDERDQDDVSSGVDGIWNKWFEEKIRYSPSTGVLKYYIDGELKITYDVGELSDLKKAKVRFEYKTQAWWTGHYIHTDDLVLRGTAGTSKDMNGFAYPVGSSGYATEVPDGDGWRNAQDFGVYNSDFDGLHLGEDWNAEVYSGEDGNKDCGLPVYATSGGTIVYAGDAAPSLGNVVVLRHQLPDGSEVESLYAHLESIAQTSGTVGKREQIGTIGDADGYYTYCHLHFGIRLPSSSDWGNPGPGYATSTDGWTDPSDYIDDNTPAPSGLAATPGDGEVTLSWNALPESDLDGYNVYRATTSFSDLGNAEKITDAPVGTPSYADGTVDGGTTYYYRVTAVPADGPESGPSGQASATLQSLQLLGLEVNQSVQTWNNSVPLIEGKETIVRVHLQNKREGDTPVNVTLVGRRNGNLLEPPTLMNDNYECRLRVEPPNQP